MMKIGHFDVATDETHPDCLLFNKQMLTRLEKLASFFTPSLLRETVLPFLQEPPAASLSLRLIDFAVQHMPDASWVNNGTLVYLGETYRSWLRVWKRKLFDPFRRHERVYFFLDGKWWASTVAQLNFFYFAVQTGFLAWVRENAVAIDKRMREFNRHRRRKKIPRTPAPCVLLSARNNCVFHF